MHAKTGIDYISFVDLFAEDDVELNEVEANGADSVSPPIYNDLGIPIGVLGTETTAFVSKPNSL